MNFGITPQADFDQLQQYRTPQCVLDPRSAWAQFKSCGGPPFSCNEGAPFTPSEAIQAVEYNMKVGAYQATPPQRKEPALAPAASESAKELGKQQELGPSPDTTGLSSLGQLMGTDKVELSPQATLRLTEEMLKSKLGEQLTADFGEHGIDLAAQLGVDMSPDATAQRIVGFATGLKEVFLRQNEGLSQEEGMALFEKTIRGAVSEGFAEAREVLDSMNLSEATQDITNATYARVETLFDEYFHPEKVEAENPPDGEFAAAAEPGAIEDSTTLPAAPAAPAAPRATHITA